MSRDLRSTLGVGASVGVTVGTSVTVSDSEMVLVARNT
jgi:hypothetical protein